MNGEPFGEFGDGLIAFDGSEAEPISGGTPRSGVAL